MAEFPRFDRFAARLASPVKHWCGVRLSMLAAAAFFLSAVPIEEAPRAIRVRFEWYGQKPEMWAGVLETTLGTIVEPSSLGVAPDEAGTVWADGKNLWLQRRGFRVSDGFDATIIAPPSARVSFTLQTIGPNPSRQCFECELSELQLKPKKFAAQNQAARLSVRRAPGDVLRIVPKRPHLIYHPGELFQALLIPDRAPGAKTSDAVSLDWEICSSRDGNILQTGSHAVAHLDDAEFRGGLPVELRLPVDEASYHLHFRLVGKEIRRQDSTAQVLVLADQSPCDTNPNGDKEALIDHFRPEERGVLRPIPHRPAQSPTRQNDATFPGIAGLDGAVEEPTDPSRTADWTAYRLQVKHPQRLHRLVVRIAAKGRPFVGISVLEPNSAQHLTPRTLDTGVVVGRSSSVDSPSPTSTSSESPVVLQQVLFWPRVSEPILLLHDMGTGRPPEILDVKLYELPSRPPASPAEAFSTGDERLVGPYLSKPILPENFGAPTAPDPSGKLCLDDWETFHAAARHAADYLRCSGFNSLLLAVMADGSTIYPSPLVEPTPRFDNGQLSSSGQDPVRKDFLELLFRVFDREKLVLVPELQFSTPLPALERLLAGDAAEAEGIELIGRDGRNWREARRSVHGLAPYYNPLDPRVQNAIADVVRELVERYCRHASFQGVALELSGTGYLQLPGAEWGYDDATIARFQHDTGVHVDGHGEKDRYQHRHEVLSGEARSQWIRWRCRELARFHRRLAELVTSAHPHARLILACRNVLSAANSDEDVRRELRTRGRLGDLLPDKGLDFSLLEDVPRVVVLRPMTWRVSTDAEDGLLDDAVNYNASFDSAFRAPESGVLSFRQPWECRVTDFDGVAPWSPAGMRLAVHASPDGRESRRRFVRSLASSDAQIMFDGGWMAPLGQEKETREAREIVRALPRIPFYKAEFDGQPVVIRVARRDKKTYLYIVNLFGEPVKAIVQLSCPAGTKCRPLGSSRTAQIEADSDSTSRLDVPLDGYGLAAWTIELGDVRVQGVRVEMPASALASLETRMRTFERRLADARQVFSTNQNVATNSASPPSERLNQQASEQEIPVAGVAYWSVDRADLQSGRNSLVLAVNRDERPARFAGSTQSTRSLSTVKKALLVTLRLRGDRENVPVRLTFEAAANDVPIARHIDVTAGIAWRPVEFRIEDLPEGSLPQARIRIEALGQGHIWADGVTVDTERLSDDDLRQLAKISLEIAFAWDEKRFAECQRLLDGYWGRYLLLETERLAGKPVFREALKPPQTLKE